MGVHDPLEGQVDACGDEGGRDGQTDDLEEEGALGPEIGVREDTARVAEDFERAAEGEGESEGKAVAASKVC